jgi:hypothetical protein
MLLLAKLVHAEPGCRVVQVRGYDGDQCLGSALGEASTAEEAEDRARQRLLNQLPSQRQAQEAAAPAKATAPPSAGREVTVVPAPVSTPIAPSTPDNIPAQGAGHAAVGDPDQAPDPDPEDWSSELAGLDLQLRRLGWDREQEAIYLTRAFGHGSRSRLTAYGDLLAYLRALEGLTPPCDPSSCAVPLRRSDLLSQCDQLLAQLGWDASRGRRFLEQHLGQASRQQLSDSQLLNFNVLLEGELIGLET